VWVAIILRGASPPSPTPPDRLDRGYANFGERAEAEVGALRRAVPSPHRSTKKRRRRRTVDFLRKRLPSQVGRYLQGVQFPARKEELLGRLERNGVPGPLIGQLRKRLPEGEYRGPQDVLSALRRGR
jgi:hypothetical protein